MKLAYPTVITESSKPLMGFCGPLQNNAALIAEYGYTGLELLVRDPKELDVLGLEHLLHKHNLEVAAFATSPMIAVDNLSLISPNLEYEAEALKRCMELLTVADYFSAPVTVGKFRGNLGQQDSGAKERMNRVFDTLCEFCEHTNTFIVMEPQKPDNVDNLNTIEESLQWLQRMNQSKLKLLVDTFHMHHTEPNQTQSIQNAAGHIGFVHLSDTDRLPPGCGTLDFSAILNVFADSGYGGFYSMEIRQAPSSRDAARVSAENLKQIIHTA